MVAQLTCPRLTAIGGETCHFTTRYLVANEIYSILLPQRICIPSPVLADERHDGSEAVDINNEYEIIHKKELQNKGHHILVTVCRS